MLNKENTDSSFDNSCTGIWYPTVCILPQHPHRCMWMLRWVANNEILLMNSRLHSIILFMIHVPIITSPSNHSQLYSSFHSFWLDWLFERRIQMWPLDSPHKGPEMRKAFPCHRATMVLADFLGYNGSLNDSLLFQPQNNLGFKKSRAWRSAIFHAMVMKHKPPKVVYLSAIRLYNRCPDNDGSIVCYISKFCLFCKTGCAYHIHFVYRF